MLELKIKSSNEIDEAGKRIIVVDNTGEYSTDNLGGYGLPNEDRDRVAVFCLAYLNKADGTKLSVEVDPYNPLTTTTWNIVASTDGWYSIQLVYAPIYVDPDPTDFLVDDIIFDSNNLVLLKGISNGVGGVVFIEATPEDLIETNSSDIYDELFLANLSFLKIGLNQKIVELLIDSENISNKRKIASVREAYNDVRSIIQGSIYQFCIGNKYQAERQVEFLLTNNYEELY